MITNIRHLVLGLFIVVQYALSAQDQNKADSAVQILESESSISAKDMIDLLRVVSDWSTNPQQAIEYSERLIALSRKQEFTESLIRGYINLGYNYTRAGMLEDALLAYNNLKNVADSIGLPAVKGDAFANMALAHKANHDYQKAKQYELEASKIYNELGDSSRFSNNLLNLGNTYYYLDELDSGLDVLEQCYRYMPSSTIRPYLDATAGLLLGKLNETDSAEKLIFIALQDFEKYQDHYAASDTKVQYGTILFNKGELAKSLDFLNSGFETARKYGLKEQARDASEILSIYYSQQKDLGKILYYQDMYYSYRDSIINTESIRKMAAQQTRFEVGLKQAEVNLLTEQRRTQQILSLSLAIVAVLVITVAFIIYRSYQEKNRINHILEDQKAQLERLNSTKDRFFSIISHDLRGPIAAFHGVSRMIQVAVNSKQTDVLLEIAEEIDNSTDRLSSLLDNLLKWALQQQGHFPYVPERLDLKSISDDLVTMFSNMSAAKKLSLTASVDPKTFPWADKNATETILRNLVGNALKFTPEGGEVSLAARMEGEKVCIEIADTGVGIPVDRIKKIFELQEKKSTYGTGGEKGLGLGLQLVHEFVRMNNGEILVESVEGAGTTFKVWLPAFAMESQGIRT